MKDKSDNHKETRFNFQKADVLIIETFAYCPHLETAGEIAIKYRKEGVRAGIVFIDVDNPDDYIPKRVFVISRSRRNRVEALFRILSKFGINCLVKTPDQSLVDLLFEKIKDQIRSCNNVDCLRKIELNNIKIGMGVASSYVSYMKDIEPDIDKALIERYFKSAIATYVEVEKLIQYFKPSQVVTYNGRFACSKPIIYLCKKYSIPVFYHERGATKERYYLSDKPPHDFKAIRASIKKMWELSQDQNKEEIAESYFLRKIKGEGIGWVSFTEKQIKGMVPEKSKKYRWTYYSSSDDEYIYVEDSIEHPIFKSQIEAIRWLINYAAQLDDVELVIRVHPHKEQKSQRLRNFWNNLGGKNVSVIPSHSPIDSYALAKNSDLIIVYSSTMGVEAAYLGKPVITIGDATYKGLDCTYEPSSLQELKDYLSLKKLEPKEAKNSLPFGYYYMLYGNLFSYYKPYSLFQGKFVNDYLFYENQIFSRLHEIKLKLTRLFQFMKRS
ncbi:MULTISPECIES: hypothetical protein [unclassified Thermosynechococcus]|uniref:capsular polysaccharide export protein, LipB/KpsS family n=1 Tax=unclassified Thermosynechococcus TaxID=2622553 RepID=UPI0028773B0F|nr:MULTISPECIES: hypothetical protein [unclassified Thermosynechococcus]WNC52878.1 hypothetical protein RHJ02_00710 [Thermosynechococcus sp. TG215]WNC57969.1 hypothetical protein RHJ13_00715 [Thermosynechococcus sp. TG218]